MSRQDTQAPPATELEGRPAPTGASLVVYRALLGLMVGIVLFQAAMAGRFLDGDGAALVLHETGFFVLFQMSLVGGVTALVAWLRRRVAGWHAAVTGIALPLLIYTQGHLGFLRQLDLHVPLGVALLGMTLGLLLSARSTAARPRRGAEVPGSRDA